MSYTCTCTLIDIHTHTHTHTHTCTHTHKNTHTHTRTHRNFAKYHGDVMSSAPVPLNAESGSHSLVVLFLPATNPDITWQQAERTTIPMRSSHEVVILCNTN